MVGIRRWRPESAPCRDHNIGKREDLEAAMKKIEDHDGPALLDVVCDVGLI